MLSILEEGRATWIVDAQEKLVFYARDVYEQLPIPAGYTPVSMDFNVLHAVHKIIHRDPEAATAMLYAALITGE